MPIRQKTTTNLLAVALFALTPLASQADGLRFPFTGSLQGAGVVILPVVPPSNSQNPAYWSHPEYPGRCGGAPVLVTEAAGTTSLLGVVDDFQVHCLGNPVIGANGQVERLPFFNGRFRFTDTKGRYVEGEYRGNLTPTVASRPPPGPGAPPTGTWIIEGQVCIRGASPQLRIADDCAANRYFPARGISDPLAGTATIYINQTLGVRW